MSSVYEGTWRFKYSGTWSTDGKNGWLPEYQVNETPMTAAQLAAINSNITSAKVELYDEALTKFNYELYSPRRESIEISPSIFPITYTKSGVNYTVQYSDVGTTLEINMNDYPTIGLYHNNGVDTHLLITLANGNTGLYSASGLSYNL